MKKIGLTGNIGSGKSLVGNIFKVLGISVFDADQEGKKVLHSEELTHILRKKYGKRILKKDGSIDRDQLGNIVFSDPAELQSLNQLIHPRVKKAWEDRVEEYASHPYVLHEAAILFESGFDQLMDAVILVSAPEQIRLQRVMERDGITEEKFYLRAQRQWDESLLLSKAAFVIDNSGDKALIPQVLAIDSKLRQED